MYVIVILRHLRNSDTVRLVKLIIIIWFKYIECALTGDLKIVRMDQCTSPARGGKEIFLLVERVTKSK